MCASTLSVPRPAASAVRAQQAHLLTQHAHLLLELARQVDHGHIRGRHAERHARQLAVQALDHLAHGLGGTGRRGDDVLAGATAATPQHGCSMPAAGGDGGRQSGRRDYEKGWHGAYCFEGWKIILPIPEDKDQVVKV